jgi:hypothetical protein
MRLRAPIHSSITHKQGPDRGTVGRHTRMTHTATCTAQIHGKIESVAAYLAVVWSHWASAFTTDLVHGLVIVAAAGTPQAFTCRLVATLLICENRRSTVHSGKSSVWSGGTRLSLGAEVNI